VLPEFSFERTVSANDGKHDKTTLHVRHRTYPGTVEDINTFRHFLGVAPPTPNSAIAPATANSATATAELGEYYGRIFNRPSETGTFRKPMQIRSSRRRSSLGIPVPLFPGRCKFLSHPSNSERVAQIETVLELFPNPTRFLRNQGAGYIPPRRNFASTSATFYESGNVHEGDEYSLDQTDNWIPDLPPLERWDEPGFNQRTVRDFLEGVMREIDRDTERAASLPEVQLASISFSRRKLARGAQQTGTFPQRTAGQLCPHWRSRSDQYGSR
jgi:hypothetical protein